MLIWRIHYADGTQLTEYDGRDWNAQLDKPVKAIALIAENGGSLHLIYLPDGAIPVFFRRHRIIVDLSGDEQSCFTIHCIGWKHGEQGTYLFTNGSVTLLSNDLNPPMEL